MIRDRITSLQNTLRNDRSLQIGVSIGAVGLLISLLVQSLVPGRLLGDPLPVLLILSQLLRGFTQGVRYIQWDLLLYHLLFLLFLGASVLVGNLLLARREFGEVNPARASRFAVALNIVSSAVFEIDSLMVGLWYLAAGYLSLSFAGVIIRALSQFIGQTSSPT